MTEQPVQTAERLAEELRARGHGEQARHVEKALEQRHAGDLFLEAMREAAQTVLTAIESIDPATATMAEELRLEVDKRIRHAPPRAPAGAISGATPAPGPVAMEANQAPVRPVPAAIPQYVAQRLSGRERRTLGESFGLANFGVNLARLAPGAMSSFRHAHAAQDEFVYVLQGEPTLVTNAGRTILRPGWCAGFKAGTGDAHHLVNETNSDVVYLEVGDRSGADVVTYPDDDLHAEAGPDGRMRFTRKDGSPL